MFIVISPAAPLVLLTSERREPVVSVTTEAETPMEAPLIEAASWESVKSLTLRLWDCPLPMVMVRDPVKVSLAFVILSEYCDEV